MRSLLQDKGTAAPVEIIRSHSSHTIFVIAAIARKMEAMVRPAQIHLREVADRAGGRLT